MKTTNQRNQFINLRAQNYSFDKIAGEMRIAKGTLLEWEKEHLNEISELKKVEFEKLQEKFELTKLKELEILGRNYKKIIDELEKRNLNDTPTYKLYELMFKFQEIFASHGVVNESEEQSNLRFIPELLDEIKKINDDNLSEQQKKSIESNMREVAYIGSKSPQEYKEIQEEMTKRIQIYNDTIERLRKPEED
jgi:hypothetical protein